MSFFDSLKKTVADAQKAVSVIADDVSVMADAAAKDAKKKMAAVVDDVSKAADKAAKEAKVRASAVADNVSEVSGNAMKEASKALDSASEVAKKTMDDSSKFIETASKQVAKSFEEGKVIVSSLTSTAYDSLCEITAEKIKWMIRGLDLQAAIDSLNKVSKEKDIDVSNLVAFIKDLKEYGDSGK